ncbi:MAG: ABC transporter permease subunit [Candidatus Latescibacteria bacterium]|nr:ABC transporter permease subunit [Candidatus Latescibacterota bacterium]
MKLTPRQRRGQRQALAFLAPNLIGFLLFTSLSVLFSFVLAFFRWDTFSAPVFIGFDNFIRLLTDPKLWFYFYNTVFLMLGLPLSIGASLFLAVLLSQKLRGIIVYRTVFYLPTVTNGVALFLLWKWLYNPKYGLVNTILLPILSWPHLSLLVRLLGLALLLWFLIVRSRALLTQRRAGQMATASLLQRLLLPLALLLLIGWMLTGALQYGGPLAWLGGRFALLEGLNSIDDLPNWLSSSVDLGVLNWLGLEVAAYWAKSAIIIMGVWASMGGGNMILYLAALANVPEELYEASDIDGASRWQQFWHVTWPMIGPTTFFICVMSIIGGLQGGFEIAYLMTNGGPGKDGDNTVTLGYYIYRSAFENMEFGYAAAVAWFMFVIIFSITLVNWRFGKGTVHY